MAMDSEQNRHSEHVIPAGRMKERFAFQMSLKSLILLICSLLAFHAMNTTDVTEAPYNCLWSPKWLKYEHLEKKQHFD